MRTGKQGEGQLRLQYFIKFKGKIKRVKRSVARVSFVYAGAGVSALLKLSCRVWVVDAFPTPLG